MCQVKLVKADYPLTSCCQKVLSIFQMTHRHRYLRHPNEYTFCNQFDMIYEFVDGFNIEMEYSFKLCFYIRIKICVNAPNITQNWKLNGNNATRGEKKIWYTSQIIQRNQIYLIENGIFWWKKNTDSSHFDQNGLYWGFRFDFVFECVFFFCFGERKSHFINSNSQLKLIATIAWCLKNLWCNSQQILGAAMNDATINAYKYKEFFF